MDTYWIPGVNNLGQYGRWAFAEFTAVFEIEQQFSELIGRFLADTQTSAAERLIRAGGSEPNLEDIPRRRSELAE